MIADVGHQAKHLFIREMSFCKVMHYASFNGALLDKPVWGLVEELTLDDVGLSRLHEEKELVLGAQGMLICTTPQVDQLMWTQAASVIVV